MTTLQWADVVRQNVEGDGMTRAYDFTAVLEDADLWKVVTHAFDQYGPFDRVILRQDQAERLRRETGQRDTLFGVRVEVDRVTA